MADNLLRKISFKPLNVEILKPSQIEYYLSTPCTISVVLPIYKKYGKHGSGLFQIAKLLTSCRVNADKCIGVLSIRLKKQKYKFLTVSKPLK